ncbi:hypothetical protein [Aliarcobacter butzleri]|uniref:hypothetical protein n=1 Tax=Aliarcobacter butzleri TaxID=28197 RepID=UPI001260BA10|nr:hypothetical protein [Aliarcobacter butzleri]
MPYYIINKNQQNNGDHEVHEKGNCQYMPNIENQIDLGWHSSCHSAVADAKKKWPNHRINGCYYCCKPCHTS